MRACPERPLSATETHETGCGVCGAATGDLGRLCGVHSADLTVDLRAVPGLVDDLEVTVTRQARITVDSSGGRSAERPLPWNEHASTVASVLNTTINAWALDVSRLGEDERDRLGAIHYADTAAVADWLRRNLSGLRRHAEAGRAHDELTYAVRQARRAVDRPIEREVYGQCTAELEDGSSCPEYLYAPPGRPTVTCGGCGSVHDTAKRRAWMFLYVRDRVDTIRGVVACLTLGGIRTTEDKVRLMASRGRFLSVGQEASGRPLYRVSDVLAAIEDRYRHRKPRAA